MRCFLAVPVEGAALAAGVSLLDRLRAELPGVRWVSSEGLHLTLHFFATLADEEAPRVLAAAAEAAAQAAPFRLRLGGLGCFPRDGDERVLWIGVQDGAAAMAALQRDVEDALGAAGYPHEQRAYAPHLTLGRPRRRFDAGDRARWQRFAGESLSDFGVQQVLLYQSHLGPQGSRYEVVGRAPLSGAP